jgi:hypothetical protein
MIENERQVFGEHQGLKLTFNFSKQTGCLYMPPDMCCDMTACIRLFRAVSSDVQLIKTFVNSVTDTTYRRCPNGLWEAQYRGKRSEKIAVPPGPTPTAAEVIVGALEHHPTVKKAFENVRM